MKVSFVLHPNPALLDETGRPYGPIRTNIFPQPQITLATALPKNEYEIEFLDARAIEKPLEWQGNISKQYASPVHYGNERLTRHFIGNPAERIFSSSRDADVYALSANFTYEANSIAETIKVLKLHNTKAVVIVGGTDAAPPERHDFYFKSGADYIGLGDADLSLPEFLSDLRNGNAEAKYPNRLIPAKGQIHSVDLSLLKGLTDTARFSESGGGSILEAIARKGFAAYIEMQRGCNRECDFCYAANTPFNRLSVEDTKRQIDNFLANGVGLFMFTDDNTLLRKRRDLVEIFDYLRTRGASWEFPNGLEFGLLEKQDETGEYVPKKDLIDALFWNNNDQKNHAGVYRLLFPLEDSLLRKSNLLKLARTNKEIALEELIHRNVPYINLGIMTGGPQETQDERRNMEKWLSQFYDRTRGANTKFNYSLFCTMPLPGTEFGRQMQREGRIRYDIDRFPELWNVFLSVVDGDNFTAEQNTQFRKDVLQQFGMQQDLGKVGTEMQSQEYTANITRGNIIPFNTAKRFKSSLAKNVAALAASFALATGIGSQFYNNYQHNKITAQAEQIRQIHINEIPAFVFSGSPDSPYGLEFFLNRAAQRANKDIEEKYRVNNFFKY